MSKLLSICIPTYNRTEFIKRQVRLLIPQLNKEVDLYVYDNCSEIPVASFFTQDELSKFTIIRNSVNVGADANIARCFENCNSSWLWTLSDDDFVKNNAVEILIQEIKKSPDYVFLNYLGYRSFDTKGFDELIPYFREEGVFSNSFSMSNCIYNMSELKGYLHNYYSVLSSMVGTIIMVLKYLRINSDARCRFINSSLISDYNDSVSWNYSLYIMRSRLFIESFRKINDKLFNKTLFLGCLSTNYNLILLDRKESNILKQERWQLFWIVIKMQGIINAIKYSKKHIIMVFLSLTFGLDIFIRIKKKLKLV